MSVVLPLTEYSQSRFIDIAVIVPSLKRVRKYLGLLEKIGYVLKKEARSDRLFFTKGPEKKRTHYLHVGDAGNGYVGDMVLFRNYLQQHKSAAKNYSTLKKKLARQYSKQREIYTKKKEKLINVILHRAKK